MADRLRNHKGQESGKQEHAMSPGLCAPGHMPAPLPEMPSLPCQDQMPLLGNFPELFLPVTMGQHRTAA